MKVRPSICLIKNNKILLMRYVFNGVEVYNLPGGNVDNGETLHETLIREMHEELDIEVLPSNLVLIGEVSLIEQKEDVLHCIFEGKITRNEPVLNPLETTAKNIIWLPIEALPYTNLYPNVGTELLDRLSKVKKEVYISKINQKWF
jgi:8-oxo-dGTP diphosphatase